ncbi:hypothetical protein EHO98_20280 [Leptospira stimsonii]|uniref:Peptidase n=2 Tax=Leptospira stimsonii TaxID=2202203 RepID=A0ABY2NAP8_9LEPT|nr:hypothetical protein EHO98_20280 [Leptospira stimsonii]TGM20278.1 hypothetical protein EHQ90_02935 [Leptospira stimsonii]
MKPSVLLLLITFLCPPLFAESIRFMIEGHEFYFLKDPNSPLKNGTKEMIQEFADQFILELNNESERLNLKKPSSVSVFISQNTKIFTRTTGQPSFIAAHFLLESEQFHFQNPSLLKKKNILSKSIRHEICHYFSPHIDNFDLRWLEESYCESLYPTNAIVSKNFLQFPNSWEQFKQFNRDKSSDKKRELKKYELLSSWGSWILKEQGEIQFRDLLKNRVQEKEWKTLYSKFLKTQ